VLSGLGDVQIDVALAHLRDRSTSRRRRSTCASPTGRPSARPHRPRAATRSRQAGRASSVTAGCASNPTPGKGYEFVDEIVGGRIPRQFIPHVDRGVQDTMTQGVLAGYPVVDVKVAVYDGSYHAVDSSRSRSRPPPASVPRRRREGRHRLLEPIATLEIEVPDEYAGAVMGDISSMRGRILGMDSPESGVQTIKAQAPTPRSSTTRRTCAPSRAARAPTPSRSTSTPRCPSTWPRRSSNRRKRRRTSS
jgi:elongation factor G